MAGIGDSVEKIAKSWYSNDEINFQMINRIIGEKGNIEQNEKEFTKLANKVDDTFDKSFYHQNSRDDLARVGLGIARNGISARYKMERNIKQATEQMNVATRHLRNLDEISAEIETSFELVEGAAKMVALQEASSRRLSLISRNAHIQYLRNRLTESVNQLNRLKERLDGIPIKPRELVESSEESSDEDDTVEQSSEEEKNPAGSQLEHSDEKDESIQNNTTENNIVPEDGNNSRDLTPYTTIVRNDGPEFTSISFNRNFEAIPNAVGRFPHSGDVEMEIVDLTNDDVALPSPDSNSNSSTVAQQGSPIDELEVENIERAQELFFNQATTLGNDVGNKRFIPRIRITEGTRFNELPSDSEEEGTIYKVDISEKKDQKIYKQEAVNANNTKENAIVTNKIAETEEPCSNNSEAKVINKGKANATNTNSIPRDNLEIPLDDNAWTGTDLWENEDGEGRNGNWNYGGDWNGANSWGKRNWGQNNYQEDLRYKNWDLQPHWATSPIATQPVKHEPNAVMVADDTHQYNNDSKEILGKPKGVTVGTNYNANLTSEFLIEDQSTEINEPTSEKITPQAKGDSKSKLKGDFHRYMVAKGARKGDAPATQEPGHRFGDVIATSPEYKLVNHINVYNDNNSYKSVEYFANPTEKVETHGQHKLLNAYDSPNLLGNAAKDRVKITTKREFAESQSTIQGETEVLSSYEPFSGPVRSIVGRKWGDLEMDNETTNEYSSGAAGKSSKLGEGKLSKGQEGKSANGSKGKPFKKGKSQGKSSPNTPRHSPLSAPSRASMVPLHRDVQATGTRTYPPPQF